VLQPTTLPRAPILGSVDENNTDTLLIFGVDKSGFFTVQKRAGKAAGKKEKREMGALSSGVSRLSTVLVCCGSGSGIFMPSMIILKERRNIPSLRIVTLPTKSSEFLKVVTSIRTCL
jgi:hypothetical protein